MYRLDLLRYDRPGDLVDRDLAHRLLWRNAPAVLRRHLVTADGTCAWCGHAVPAPARQSSGHDDEIAPLFEHEARPARNMTARADLGRLDPPALRERRARNRRLRR